ncbi:ribonuclease H-like domain-containing protein [Tanacetum coccineum]
MEPTANIFRLCSPQRLEMASQDTRDAVTIQPMTALEIWRRHVPYDNRNNPSDQALDVFQSDLQFTKDSHVSPCDICHKAKQTREPFTLNDHKTTVIGELVHVDLWGPYKVISKDGCKLPSSFLNGKSLLELMYGVKPKLSHLRSFFCLCYSSILNNSHKFSARDIEFYENVFSFKMNYSLQPVEENHDDNINSLKFFDEKHFDEQTSFRPNDDGRVNFASNDESNVFPCSKSSQTSDECDDNIATSMAPKQWNAKLTMALIENGFVQSKFDYSLFIRKSDKVFIALLVYVDHIVITSNDLAKIEKFYMFLKSKCQIKDVGKLKYFLAIEVLDNIEGSCLSHRKYCLELLHEYGLLVAKHVDTPLLENTTLNHILAFSI